MKNEKPQLKGGKKKMKAQILLIALLVTGIFATSFAYAVPNIQNINGNVAKFNILNSKSKTIYAKNIENIEIESFDKEKILEKVESYKNKLRIGFSKSWRGNGHINNGEKGYLVSAFWTIQSFAKTNDADNTEIVEKGFGGIKIDNFPNYHLSLKEKTGGSFSFYVLHNNGDKLNIDEAGNNAIGTLELTIDEEFEGLTTWIGKLKLNEGKLAGEWEVSLATDKFVVRPQPRIDSDSIPSTVIMEDFDDAVCQSALAGDTNSDGNLDISDAIYLGMYLKNQAKLKCSNVADVNADALINQDDVDYILDYLFKGGSAPIKTSKSDTEGKIQEFEPNEDLNEFGDDVKVVKKDTPVRKGFWRKFTDLFKFR